MVELVKQFASGIYNLLLGMVTTGKHLGRHAITIQYPKERWEVPERSRGMVVLLTDHETGKLNCTACMLCMRACPTAAINIEVIKDENKKRHLKEFTVDYNICCFCGLCEEACNFAGIKLATKYEFPAYDKKDLFWDIKKLAEMGLDVPYEKPVRKKPPVKKPVAPKPTEKPTEQSAETASDKKPETAPTPESTEPKPENPPASKPAEDKSEKTPEETPAPKPEEPKTDDSGEKKEGEG